MKRDEAERLKDEGGTYFKGLRFVSVGAEINTG